MKNQKGFSLTEVIIAMAILTIVSLSIMRIQAFMSVQSSRTNEKAFATQKVIQMMEELRSLVAGSETQNINVLDNYNNGTAGYSRILTTLQGITDPASKMSGNVKVSGNWKYLRQIVVNNMADDPHSRQVFVSVFRNSTSGADAPKETLAQTSAILKTITADFVPTQSLDVYIIALENIPGWWSSLGTMRPIFGDVLQDMQIRNPGLALNTHWITRSAYGRDKRYTPYINSNSYTKDVAMPFVYFYPGKVLDDNGNDYIYYDQSIIGGKINVDGVVDKPDTYALADMYNHAVRYPEEVALYNASVAATPAGTPAPEVSLRMLLEDMNTNPAKYKNALIINLHGELLPLPPMRNYSDAAKDPGDCPNVRLVTHPEKLQYDSGAEVKLRVYPYLAKPNAEYYNDTGGMHFVGNPALSRYDSAVFFDWGNLGPAPGIGPDNFSVRWSGLIFPRFSETYTFTATTDDGVNLYINNVLQAPAGGPGWSDHTVAVPTTWNVNLTAGTTYTIKVEYYDHTGLATAQLQWSSPTQPLETVPIAVLPVSTVKVNTFLDVNDNRYFDGNLNNKEIQVAAIYGNNIGMSYSSATITRLNPTDVPPEGVPSWKVSNPDSNSTLFTFFYTPLVQPSQGTTALNSLGSPYTTLNNATAIGGQTTSYYLYNMEYTPCPITSDFSRDLTSIVVGPKNTARWIIDFAPNTISSGVLSVETRLGGDITTGTLDNHLENASTTYVWVGCPPPETEKYQFLGDPRDCPYQDVKAGNRYNWYFTQVNNADYPGFSMTNAGWGADNSDPDMPRFYQIFRSALLKTQSIWSTMNGWSYYYYGFGGEFGSDTNPLTSGLRFVKTPWSKTNEQTQDYYDEILPYTHGSCTNTSNVWAKIVATTDDKWYAKPWLGELYDDKDFSNWQADGNVPTGAPTTNFNAYYRANYDTYPAFGRKRTPHVTGYGCSSFFNGKSASGTGPFIHIGDGGYDTSGNYSGDYGLITTAVGTPMSAAFSFPLLSPIPGPRPFKLDGGSTYNPEEWNNSVYSSQRTVLAIPTAAGNSQIFYTSQNHSDMNSSAVVEMSSGTLSSYVVVSGLGVQSDFGTAQLGKLALVGMLETFFEGGLFTAKSQDTISQIPRVQITSPKVADSYSPGASVNIAWSTTWKRWDGTNYTQDYSNTYSETTPLVYAVKYSMDGGITWYYCNGNVPTTKGDKNLLYTTTATSYSWNLSGFIKGSYMIRIECFRRDIGLHYAYDHVQIGIQ
jgi:prepilin-type N-terminal cleavage/methylation domain-containing protein